MCHKPAHSFLITQSSGSHVLTYINVERASVPISQQYLRRSVRGHQTCKTTRHYPPLQRDASHFDPFDVSRMGPQHIIFICQQPGANVTYYTPTSTGVRPRGYYTKLGIVLFILLKDICAMEQWRSSGGNNAVWVKMKKKKVLIPYICE